MRIAFCSLILVCSIGCASLYEVHRGTGKVKGIPFYVQAGACTQETVYIETVYQIVVQTPGAPKKLYCLGSVSGVSNRDHSAWAANQAPPIVLMEKSVPASTYNSPEMQQFRDVITSGTAQLAVIRQRFAALKPYSPDVPAEVTLSSNVMKPERFVDYATVHYVT